MYIRIKILNQNPRAKVFNFFENLKQIEKKDYTILEEFSEDSSNALPLSAILYISSVGF